MFEKGEDIAIILTTEGSLVEMTIEELYELRKEVLENKEKFSELNSKYNKLLEKLLSKRNKEKKMTETEYIMRVSYIWYWLRFYVFMILYFVFKIPQDMALLFVLGNLGIRIFDEKVILPKLWIKRQMQGNPPTKEEIEQKELYEEVSKAREIYHELNKRYANSFSKLSIEEKTEYMTYLESLGVYADLEGQEKEESVDTISSDVKMLGKVNEEMEELI